VPRPAEGRNGHTGKSCIAKSSSLPHVHAAEPKADPNLEVFDKLHTGPDKILLRIDAFLGEWLSPDYFEDITPPPNSTMMVAGAKSALLRRGEHIEVQPSAPSSKGYFPGGWVKNNASSAVASRTNTENGTFPTMGSLAQALPRRERSGSHGTLLRQRSRSRDSPASVASAHSPSDRLYHPPIPSYAVSPADPIPRGYVNHARDACVNIDFQWDSMREPQEWGDGGDFGEEWSTMHKRFRKGLAGMMEWYREHGWAPPQDSFPGFTFSQRPALPKHAATDPGPLSNGQVDDSEDEELVLVLVTHGAGCNALLGAITNQPVLIDVGLAALSMAVLRDQPRKHSVPTIFARRSSVVDPGMADTYEMKLLASTDHLRPGVDPSKVPQPLSPSVVSSPSLEYRRRFGGSSGSNTPISQADSPFSLGPSARGWNSSLGSIRRTSTSGSIPKLQSSNLAGSSSPTGGSGLWTGALRSVSFDKMSDGRSSPGADMVANFQNSFPKPMSNPTHAKTSSSSSIPAVDGSSSPKPTPSNGVEDMEKDDDIGPLRSPKLPGTLGRTNSQSGGGLWTPKTQAAGNGLWGPPRLDEVYEHGRGPKRRWTVSDGE